MGVALEEAQQFACRAVVVTTGTFLNGLIHVGEESRPAGRVGRAAVRFSWGSRCKALGFEVGPAEDGHSAPPDRGVD